MSAALAPQSSTKGSARDGCLGRAQQPTLSASVAASDLQKNKSCEQLSTMLDKERVEISVGQIDGAAEGAFADGAQHLGVLLDAMCGSWSGS